MRRKTGWLTRLIPVRRNVCTVHFRGPWGRSVDSRSCWEWFAGVRPISVRPGCNSVRSVRSLAVRQRGRLIRWGAFSPLPTMRPWGCRNHSGAFGPFPCSLGVVGFVRVCSVHSPRTLEVVGFVRVRSLVSSVSFWSVRSISVLPGGRQVRSGVFRQFPCAPGGVGVPSVHSRALWGLSGWLGCFRPIHVRPGVKRVRWVHSCAP